MRIVVAPDEFGGTLPAPEVAAAIADGWLKQAPGDEVLQRPLSDGGPGFVDVLATALDGTRIPVASLDPLGRPVTASVLVSGTVAYVESAQACGLHLMTADERDPMAASTYGVGLLLAAAVEAGARQIVVGLGGSGTNDGGAGALAALGAGPLDAGGGPLPYGGAALLAADRLAGVPALRGATLIAATDVDNPLLGLHGAAAVFGPQKGASTEQVHTLDIALERWASVLVSGLPTAPSDLADQPGAGAAGGLGAALLALGGVREPGIALVRRHTGFDELVAGADLVITGEGSFDYQSLRGKVAAGVAGIATEYGVPCVVLAGRVDVGRREAAAIGITETYSLTSHLGSAERAMAETADGLAALAGSVARQWSRS